MRGKPMPPNERQEQTKWQRHSSENRRRNHSITAIRIPHSHSIVPGGFDVTS
jgi:hypothetical protein